MSAFYSLSYLPGLFCNLRLSPLYKNKDFLHKYTSSNITCVQKLQAAIIKSFLRTTCKELSVSSSLQQSLQFFFFFNCKLCQSFASIEGQDTVMAEGEYERTLEETPTWAVAVVCLVLVLISIFVEHIIHIIGKVMLPIYLSVRQKSVNSYLMQYSF